MLAQRCFTFLLSLTLHALIVAVILFGDQRMFWKPQLEKPQPREIVEFEIQKSAPVAKSTQSPAAPGRKTRPRNVKITKTIPLEKLIPAYDFTKTREPLLGKRPRIDQEPGAESATIRRAGPMGDPNYDAWGSEGVYGHAGSMDLPQSTETMPFFQALWQRVDQVMDFPVEIAQMRIGGRVLVHLKVNSRGEMVGDFLRIESDHPVLLTYALVILSQAMKAPLPERLHLPEGHEDVPVALTFDFRVVTLHGLYARHGGYFQNTLEFSRTRYMDPYALEVIDYLAQNYVPPIIPIPGGVYIDFVRAYKMIDNYANERPDMYDQRERQFSLLRDKLDLAVIKDEGEKAKLDATARLTAPRGFTPGSPLPRRPKLTR